MSHCPRCGWPLDPDAAASLACAQGVRRRIDRGTLRLRPGLSLRRNPAGSWMLWGAILGAGIGLVAGVIGIVVNLLVGGSPGVVLPGSTTVAGAAIGALGVLLWKSLLDPMLLALFAPERFEREYGTPEERGLWGRTKP
jgi:hypothetical protein